MANLLPMVIAAGEQQRLQVGDTLVVQGALDVLAAGTLALGAVVASAITIGSVGITTTIAGGLTVNGSETVHGPTIFNGSTIQFGDAPTDIITVEGRIGSAGTPNINFQRGINHAIAIDQAANEVAGNSLTLSGSAGGNSAGAAVGGAGGALTLAGGAGGAGTGAFAAGADASITIAGGAAGADGGGGGAAGGAVTINGGNASGAGLDGVINLGTANTSQINVGAPFSTALSLIEQGGDPGGTANQGKIYTKDVTTITELFYQNSAGVVTQITTGGAFAITDILIPDATANAFRVREAANNYIHVDTQNGTEALNLGNAVTNPSFLFAGSGLVTTTGALVVNSGAGTVATTGTIRLPNVFTVQARNNIGTANAKVLESTGVQLKLGDTAADGWSLIQLNMVSGGTLQVVSGVVIFSVTNTLITMGQAGPLSWASTNTNPVINQATDATAGATVNCDSHTIQAQGASGAAGANTKTGGQMITAGGEVTGTGTANIGGAYLGRGGDASGATANTGGEWRGRSGTGATAAGDVFLSKGTTISLIGTATTLLTLGGTVAAGTRPDSIFIDPQIQTILKVAGSDAIEVFASSVNFLLPVTSTPSGDVRAVDITSATTGTDTIRATLSGLTVGNGLLLDINSTAWTSGVGLNIDHTVSGTALANFSGGAMFRALQNATELRTSGTTTWAGHMLVIDRALTQNGVGGTFGITGHMLHIANTVSQTAGTLTSTGRAINIDHNSRSGSRIYAMAIKSDNAGAGGPGGIDMSAFSVDEPLLSAPADAITAPGTPAHQIAIQIGAAIFYLLASTHGT